MSKQEQNNYNWYLQSIAREDNILRTYKEDGIEIGYKNGYGKGKYEGIEQEKEKYKKEREKQILEMIKDGLTKETIIKYNKLTNNEIKIYFKKFE